MVYGILSLQNKSGIRVVVAVSFCAFAVKVCQITEN